MSLSSANNIVLHVMCTYLSYSARLCIRPEQIGLNFQAVACNFTVKSKGILKVTGTQVYTAKVISQKRCWTEML